MHASSRRQFLSHSASALALAATGLASRGAKAAMGPNDKFDLVVKGGEVLDPSQNLRAKRDIGIRFGADRGARGRHPGRQGAEGA